MTAHSRIDDRFFARGLRREAAAAYIGVSPAKFDDWVKDGRMPKPRQADGCKIWDRLELDESFSALPHTPPGKKDNPWNNAA